MELALLTSRREVRSFGAAGGEPGELGRNVVRRNDGRRETLPGCAQTMLEAGEAIEITTPTGGGWGKRVDQTP
jgi:5-oxoprolinase (ATP-hydrolysing)